MRAIAETTFDVIYLITVITMGIFMIKERFEISSGDSQNGDVSSYHVKGGGNSRQYKLFGIMAVTLGLGDSFHLIPRAYALCTDGLENYTAALGIGKFITSITMTVFYVLLYYVWRMRYHIKKQNHLTIIVYFLAAIRIVLCLFPQNGWTKKDAPLSWGIFRNIPFALLGLLIIILFFQKAKQQNDKAFRWMWLTITLSFGFYIPVVLWADTIPAIGMLMIPKTCAYVWTVLIGYQDMRRLNRK